MRLASKIFLTSALVIVVLAGVGVLSLRAVGRLVSVNREITTQTVPALRLAASAHEAGAPSPRPRAARRALRDAVERAGRAGGPRPRAARRVRDERVGGGPAPGRARRVR